MLAYRHLFHAGNFADVFKHALLVQLVLALHKKEKPFFVLDTHAGLGRYDLTHAWAQKNAEYQAGVMRVFNHLEAPPAMQPYLQAVRAENPDGKLHSYPGSPVLVRELLRAHDRLELVELNTKDYETLADVFAGDRQVHVHHMDGYQALKALLPPAERRGLVFIDSSFDRANEFKRLVQGLKEAYKKFATGIYALWYPLMAPTAMRAFERSLVDTGIREILQIELSVHPEDWTESMRGTGMVIVNPPFGFEDTARAIVEWLAPLLENNHAGSHKVTWLVPE